MKIKYVAVDGREFTTKKECENYESIFCIDERFEELPLQKTVGFAEDTCFGDYSYDDTMCAVKIENAEQLEIVNRWLLAHHHPDTMDVDKIGTIQLFDVYGDTVLVVGTPAEFKEKCCRHIDTFFNELN